MNQMTQCRPGSKPFADSPGPLVGSKPSSWYPRALPHGSCWLPQHPQEDQPFVLCASLSLLDLHVLFLLLRRQVGRKPAHPPGKNTLTHTSQVPPQCFESDHILNYVPNGTMRSCGAACLSYLSSCFLYLEQGLAHGRCSTFYSTIIFPVNE